MSGKHRRSSHGRIVITSVRRKQPDISKLARVLVALAMADAQPASTNAMTPAKPRHRGDEEGAISA